MSNGCGGVARRASRSGNSGRRTRSSDLKGSLGAVPVGASGFFAKLRECRSGWDVI